MSREILAQILKSTLAATNLDAEKAVIELETKVRAYELAMDQVPPDLLALTKTHSPLWFMWTDHFYCGNGNGKSVWNPIAIMAQYPCNVHRIEYTDRVPSFMGADYQMTAHKFRDLTARANAWVERKEIISQSLRSFLLSCNTVKQVVERMPELAPHVPMAAAKKSYPLVAPTDLLPGLKALGFDTTATN